MAIAFVIAPFLMKSQDSTYLAKGDEYFVLVQEFYGENSDSLIYYLELATEAYKDGKFWNEYIRSLNIFSSLYAQNKDYQSSQKYATLALEESKKYLNETDLMYATSLGNNSYSLIYTGNFNKAISQFKDVLAIERIHRDTTLILGSLKNIGDAYIELGDLDEAINYYNEALAFISDDNKKMTKNWFSDIYKKRGVAKYKMKDFESAHKDFLKAKDLISDTPNKKYYLAYNSLISAYNNIAKIHLEHNDLDSLNYFVNKAFKLSTGKYHDRKVIGYQLLGKYYLANSDYSNALKNFHKAEKIVKKKYANLKKHEAFSAIDIDLAKAYLANGDFKNASLYYKKTIVNLKNIEEDVHAIMVPSINEIYNPYEAIDAYVGLGETYMKLFANKAEVKYLVAANESYDNASNLITDVRNSFQEETSLLRYSEIALPIYEACIESALKMYENSKDKKYLIEAFNQNEKSKAILLLESINESSAIQFSNIPDSLRKKEKEYKLQISSLNRSLYNELNIVENQDKFKIEQLKRIQFSQTEEYNELIRKIEKEYPDYYQLKYNLITASLEDLQEKLQNSHTQVIEYFYGNENIYVFSITQDDIQINTIPNDPSITSNIQKLKDFLCIPPSGKNIESNLNQYIQSSKLIYDKFLKKSLQPDSKHIVIVRDGPLGYLPFEALITAAPESEQISYSLENLSYLIEEFNISYSYSSTLFLNSFNVKKQKARTTFIGVAPSFDLINGKKTRVCNENALYSLQCSEDEVMKIRNKLGGKVLIGKDATLAIAKNEITNAKIIHLATHACLDDSNPEFNKIYLSDDYLSNNELYNLKLKSELAVLSACETGSGRLAKGEGIMSLARGFVHAGCPSIVMSLWSIDDCATSKIMINFYEELYQGKQKSVALRNAKLKYIKEAKKATQHPYYWAAFVQIGNYNPIKISSSNTYLSYSIGLLILAVLFYLFGWKKYKILS